MKKTQFIELINTIKVTLVSFVSIALFVLLATTIYLGITWASTAFNLTVDETINDWKMHDAEITFPYSFTEQEIEKINNLDYVEVAEGSLSCEATFSLNKNNFQARIDMIPNKIDTIEKYKGSLPTKKGEILVQTVFAKANNIKIGDKLIFIHDEKDDTYDLYNIINEDLDALQEKQISGDGMKYLTTDTFTVTGIGTCSTCVGILKETFGVSSTTSIPNDCILYATKDSFDLKAFASYQTLLVKGKGLSKYGTSSDEYKNAYDEFKDKLEEDLKPYINERNNVVINAISNLKQKISSKIEDGEKQITDAEIEIQDGLKKIEDAEKQIEDGKLELEDAKKQLEDGEDEIQDAWIELEENQNKLNIERIKKENVENAFNVLKALSNPYNSVYKQLKNGSLLDDFNELNIISSFVDSALAGTANKQTYLNAVNEFNNALNANSITIEQYFINLYNYAEAFSSTPGGELGETLKQLVLSVSKSTDDFLNDADELINLANNEIKLFNLLHSQNKDTLFNDEVITNVNTQLKAIDQESDITNNLLPYATNDNLADARSESLYISSSPLIYSISSNVIDSFTNIWNNFDTNQKDLDDGKQQLIQADEEIEDGWDEYNKGLEEIKKYEIDIKKGKQQLIQGQKDVEEGKLKIKDNKDKINDFDIQTKDIKKYDITILGRSYNAGIATTTVPADIMNKIKYSLAILFVVVGVLVTYSALSRSVYDQTVFIGTKKALGFSRKDINMFFVMYAFLATTIGSVLGTFFARFAAEPIIIRILSDNYILSDHIYYFSLSDSIIFYLFELTVSLLITIIACNKILKRKAIKLLAGKEEQTGKVRFFENTRLWQSLPLMTKTIINNCLNDPKRVFATIVGITGFSSIMICAMVLFTSINDSINYQFNTLLKFDTLVYFDTEVKDAKTNIENKLNEKNISNVDIFCSTYTVENDDDTYLSASVFVYDDPKFLDFFKMSNNGLPINTKGLCLSKAYSTFRDKKQGDILSFIDNKGNKHDLPIVGIFDNYLTKVEIVMDNDTYKEEMGENVESIAFVVDRKNESIENIYDELKDINGFVSIVDYNKESRDLLNMLRNPMYGLSGIFFLLAIVLAFLVLLNLLVMFVDEKKKELIVLMINGYSRKDAQKYIYGDTIVLTIIGIICGTILGAIIGFAVVGSLDSDLITLIRRVNIPSYLICALLTSSLSAITCIIALSRIKHFKLTEVNKS